MSQQRGCRIRQTEATTWVLELENAYSHDWKTYGPFKSATAADEYLSENFSNPGGMMVLPLEDHICNHDWRPLEWQENTEECRICWAMRTK